VTVAKPADGPASAPARSVGARPWLAFATCGAIWGSTFLVISIGNDTLAPVWAAGLRLALASIWTSLRRVPLPKGPALGAAIGYGVCQFGINMPLLYWGEKLIPSGLSAVFYATIPLSSALITRAMGMERLNAFKIVGALTAFGGVALLFSSSFQGAISPVGMLAVQASATIAGVRAAAALSHRRRVARCVRDHVVAREPLAGDARQLHLGDRARTRAGPGRPRASRTLRATEPRRVRARTHGPAHRHARLERRRALAFRAECLASPAA